MQKLAYPQKHQYQYSYGRIDSPIVTGLFVMLIGGVLIVFSYFSNDRLGHYLTFWFGISTIGIVGLIFEFIGFIKIYKDRHSYTELYATNMKQSFIFYISGFIIYLCPIVILNIITLASNNGFGIYTSRIIFYIYLASTLLGLTSWILGRYKVLLILMPRNQELFLRIALYVFFISLLLIIIPFILIFTSSFGQVYRIYVFGKDLIIISHILFVICFFFAYDYQKRNLHLSAN